MHTSIGLLTSIDGSAVQQEQLESDVQHVPVQDVHVFEATRATRRRVKMIFFIINIFHRENLPIYNRL